MENNPLVSIIVITYNSSQFVLETLNSAINQTYRNIEIIISDDCSTDNTVEICRQWIADHADDGIRLELVTTEKNTGTSGNCNRGLRASKGEWIKVIGGDDVFTPTAIEDYMLFVNDHPDVKHLVGNIVKLSDKLTETDFKRMNLSDTFMFRPEVTAKMQYSIIGKLFFGSGPTYFIHADTLKSLGGYDERFPLQEDYPLFIKMIGAGYKMEFLNKVTVLYRVNESSVSHAIDNGSIFSRNRVRMIMDYKYEYRKEALNTIWRFFHNYSLAIQTAIVKNGNSKRNPLCVILKVIYSITDPFVIYARLCRLGVTCK